MTETEFQMFKQYDVRVRHSKLSEDNADRLCKSVAIYYRENLKADSIVIGRDARLYAADLVAKLSFWMRKVGIEVLVNPLPISTCQFYFTCMQNRKSAGIMVTASHNPGEYIGMKFMGPNLFPIALGYGPDGGIEKIREIYEQNPQVKDDFHAKMKVVNYLNEYVEACMKLADVKEGSLSGLKILLEFLNGSAGTEVALAFQKAGAEVECRNVIPDGLFPLGDPNPVVESSIAPAREVMKNGGFDIGFCFDGDGDRLDLMGPDGQQIVPGLNMSLIIKQAMKIFNGTMKDFYADVRSMPVSLLEMAKAGAKVHLIRNGHSFIKGKLKDNACNGYFGSVEESAHYYLNFPFDTSDLSKGYAAIEATLFFALLSARCYKENPQLYERAFRLQKQMFRVREWPLFCEAAPEKMPELMENVKQTLVKEGASVLTTMDDGSDIDATLLRINLPQTFDENSSLEGKLWSQVAQRISRSEDSICRWEVVSSTPEECERINNLIKSVTDRYVANGWAKYKE